MPGKSLIMPFALSALAVVAAPAVNSITQATIMLAADTTIFKLPDFTLLSFAAASCLCFLAKKSSFFSYSVMVITLSSSPSPSTRRATSLNVGRNLRKYSKADEAAQTATKTPRDTHKTSFKLFTPRHQVTSAATAFAPNAKTAPQTIDFNHASLDNLLRYSDNKFFTDIFYLLYFKSSRLSQAAARGGTGKQAVRPAFPF